MGLFFRSLFFSSLFFLGTAFAAEVNVSIEVDVGTPFNIDLTKSLAGERYQGAHAPGWASVTSRGKLLGEANLEDVGLHKFLVAVDIQNTVNVSLWVKPKKRTLYLFAAPWCQSCSDLIVSLNKYLSAYPKVNEALDVVVFVETGEEPFDQATREESEAYLKRLNVSFRVATEYNWETHRRFFPNLKKSLPSAVLLSKDGRTEGHTLHKTFTEKTLISRIENPGKNREAKDILWVIDNSGSKAVLNDVFTGSTKSFLDELIRIGKTDWKMGIISTSFSQKSYLGMTENDPFNAGSKNPLQIFFEAFKKMGSSGDALETAFFPIKKHLEENPKFLRDSADLVIVFLTDAPEQSDRLGVANQRLSAADTLTFLKSKKKYSQEIRSLGIFSARDLGCAPTDDVWNYKGSRYEQFISATNGTVIPLCHKDMKERVADAARALME